MDKLQNSVDFLDDINNKFADLEHDLEQKLRKILADEQNWENTYGKIESNKQKCIETDIVNSLETARKRNYQILKDIEMTKARLRSRATFSPLELVLQKAIYNYVKFLATKPVGVKKTYGPIFV